MISLLKNSSKLYLPLVYIFLTTIFLIHYLFSGQAVYGDGVGYYSYMHSWYFDLDNNFTNEYKHIYNYENNNKLYSKTANVVQIVGTNRQGQALNHFSPGMAILLMPFYILADTIVMVANTFGASLARNGYSNIYQIISGMGAISYVVLTVWLSEKLLDLFNFKLITSRSAILALLFSTNLLYYGSFDVLNSHFASFFLSTLFFLYFFKHKRVLITKNYLVLGLITALITLTRPQDGIVSVVILINSLSSLKTNKFKLTKIFKNLLAFLLPLILMITPLIIQWTIFFDSIDSHPYFMWMIGKESNQSIYDLIGTLFHHTNGLFTRTPIIFLAVLIFLRLVYKKKLGNSLKLFFIYFCFQYLIIVLQGGWKAAAYGGRMYISLLPFFLILIAKLIEWIENKYSNKIKWLFIIFFVFINILSIFSFVLFEKEASNNKRGTEIYTFKRIIKIIDKSNFQ